MARVSLRRLHEASEARRADERKAVVDAVAEAVAAGRSERDVANEVGVSRRTLRKWLGKGG